jgi:hypothetical protein
VARVADAEDSAIGAFPFDSEERLRWHYMPNETSRARGSPIKDMNEPQRALAHDLLKTGLSARGYLDRDVDHGAREGPARDRRRACAGRETTRRILFRSSARRRQAAWGWRFEGHHISVRFDVVGAS